MHCSAPFSLGLGENLSNNGSFSSQLFSSSFDVSIGSFWHIHVQTHSTTSCPATLRTALRSTAAPCTHHCTAWHGTPPHPTTQHNTTQHNTTQHNTTQHNTTQHNTTQHNTTQHNTTQHSTTQHNTTQHNTTQHNTTQHNTTQHNTTQHNTTQHPATGHATPGTLFFGCSIVRQRVFITTAACWLLALWKLSPQVCHGFTAAVRVVGHHR